jgi:hypothetical protein
MAAPSPSLFSDGLTTMLRSARHSLDRAPDLAAAAGCTATRPKQLALGPRRGGRGRDGAVANVVSGPRDERVWVWSHAATAGEESRNDGDDPRFESGGVAGFGGNGGRWRGRFGKSGVLFSFVVTGQLDRRGGCVDSEGQAIAGSPWPCCCSMCVAVITALIHGSEVYLTHLSVRILSANRG